MGAEDVAPEHDPLAEEMDLITFQEADARLYKELQHTQRLVEQLRTTQPVDQEELGAQQTRLDALKRIAERLRRQRTQPPIS
jgi:cell division FtsZ-interacting protein ZapD